MADYKRFRLGRYPRIQTTITANESEALVSWLEPCKQILEVGSADGYSAVLLAGQPPTATGYGGHFIVSVDHHQEFGSWIRFQHAIRAYGVLHRVLAIKGSNREILPRLSYEFDGAFIDGGHSLEDASFDFLEAIRLVEGHGIIAIHDYSPLWPSVVRAADNVLGGLDVLDQVDSLRVFRRGPREPLQLNLKPLWIESAEDWLPRRPERSSVSDSVSWPPR